MEKKFKEAQIVKLKIWGKTPLRVVEYYYDYTPVVHKRLSAIGGGEAIETTVVICEWYDDNLERHQKNFEEDLLEPYDK